MSAKLVVCLSDRTEQEFWIEDSVLRIGSDPRCDVEVPDPSLPPHVATVEYMGGQYYLYNRSTSPFDIANRTLPAGGKSVWPWDAELLLPGGTRVRLEAEGDPAPSPAPRNSYEDDEALPSPDGGSPGLVTPKPQQSKAMQLALIFLLFGGAGVLGFMAFAIDDGTPAPARHPIIPYARIVKEINAPEVTRLSSKDPNVQAIIEKLRESHLHDTRDDRASARANYLQLIAMIRARRPVNRDFATAREKPKYDANRGFATPVEELIYRHTLGQLDDLTRRSAEESSTGSFPL